MGEEVGGEVVKKHEYNIQYFKSLYLCISTSLIINLIMLPLGYCSRGFFLIDSFWDKINHIRTNLSDRSI